MCILTALYDTIQWDEWTAVGTIGMAVITFALAIIGFITICQQRKQFKILRQDENERAFKTNSVVLITDFDKQFEDLIDERREVGEIILTSNLLENDSFDYSILSKRMDSIFDFFDTLGYLVDQKYIKADIVHQYFDYWFSHYYEFYKLYQIKQSAGYPETVWNNMDDLSVKLDEIELTQHGKKREKINKTDLKEFFEEEL